MRRPHLAALIAALLLEPVAAPVASAGEPAPRVVRIATEDGMSLAASWWAVGDESGPAVLLVHMLSGNRQGWAPLVPELLARSISVLAIDLRGHGESARQGGADLAARVKARDPALFAQMPKDVAAALAWLATEGKRPAARTVVIAASVGASVTVEALARSPEAAAGLLLLTPVARFLDLDTVARAKEIAPGVAAAVAAHEGEWGSTSAGVFDALAGSRSEAARAHTARRVFAADPPPGAPGAGTFFHGVRALGNVPLLESWIADWCARATGADPEAPLLDGDVSLEADAAAGGAWTKATALETAEGGHAFARIAPGPPDAPRRVVLGGTVPQDASNLLVLVHAFRGDAAEGGTSAFARLEATVSVPGGEMIAGITDATAAEGWPQPPVNVVYGPAAGGLVPFEGEVRLPPMAATGEVKAWVAFGWVAPAGAKVPPNAKRGDPATWTALTPR